MTTTYIGSGIQKTIHEDIITKGDKTFCKRKTTYRGPPAVIQRMQWAKFGKARPMPGTWEKKLTRVDNEVKFEFIKDKEQVLDDPEWQPNGWLITLAQKNKWSELDISKIAKSRKPLDVYIQILKQKARATVSKDLCLAEAKSCIISKTPAGTPAVSKPARTGLAARRAHRQMTRETETVPEGGGNFGQRQRAKRITNREEEYKKTLFVENVPDDYERSDIEGHLRDFNIVRVSIVRGQPDHQGVRSSIGKAFVECRSIEAAQECLKAITGSRWGHQIVSAQISRPKKK